MNFSKKLISVLTIPALVLTAVSCSSPKKDDSSADTTIPTTTNEQQITTPETTEIESESETAIPEPEPPEDIKDKKADEICASHGAVGVQIAIIKDGKIKSTYEYGTADKSKNKNVTPETKFRVASLSKLATAIVFMALKDKGVTDTKADISDYLGYKVRNPYYPDTVITPELLMTHFSSVVDNDTFLSSRLNGSSKDMKSLLSGYGCFGAYKPGTGYSYSNLGIAIIGAVCEKAENRHFNEMAKEYLFEKLGIDAAFTAKEIKNKDDIAVLYGNGGYSIEQQMKDDFCEELGQTHHVVQGNLTISATDYAKILCMLINDGKTEDGTVILSSESVKEMLTAHYSADGEGMGYGLWFNENVIKGKNLAVHTGSNFGMFSSFVLSPETGDGMVVLTSGADSTRNYQADMPQVCLDLVRHFMEKG